MDTCKVIYEEWQLTCCGTPFAIGDKVEWLVLDYGKVSGVTPPDVASRIGKVDYFYEAHSSDWESLCVLTGVVRSIRGIYYRYGAVPGQRALVPQSGHITELQSSDVEDSIEDMSFAEYLVELESPHIRPAQKEEVTFR